MKLPHKGKREKPHPLLLVLNIVIAALTLFLAVAVFSAVRNMRESAGYRLSADNYTYTLQNGDYRSLANSFYLSSWRPVTEEELPAQLIPYAAVAGYYKDAFLLGVYETMEDAARTADTKAALAAERAAMGIYAPEADKIDKIFDIK